MSDNDKLYKWQKSLVSYYFNFGMGRISIVPGKDNSYLVLIVTGEVPGGLCVYNEHCTGEIEEIQYQAIKSLIRIMKKDIEKLELVIE